MIPLKVVRLVKLVSPLGEALLFNRLEGSDGLSRNGEYRVTVLSRRPDIKGDELLGKSVSVKAVTPRGGLREFNGLAVGFYQVGQQGRYHQYLIVVRPWTWLLTRTSDCKIFQDKTVRQIIEAVLADHPYADFEFQLAGQYTPWDYCVQYRESDFNFLARLMEQEGIHFFFRHHGGKHTLVIADGAQAHAAAAGYASLPFIEPEATHARQEEGVRDWTHGSEIQPTRFIQRDFNFEKPRADLQADASPARPLKHEHAARLDVFDYPGEYLERSDGQRIAAIRVEEMRHPFDQFSGESNALGLASGGLFKLMGHPRADQNQEYLITGADYRLEESPPESELAATELFSVRLQAIPSAQTYQPPRLTPKPIVQGPQTAIVVGKAGDEIHTDKYGRVKVQFHWDRYGQKDENSSCWIRVSHPWAGQNWGMIAIPRIGQEVIVEFLEGDPDRPIITGRVYNADQMPPYALPANMTQSGIKTRSSKGGGVGNFNEIRFEDKKGAEQLYVHAEKNQDNVVENDASLSVGHDRKKTIGHNETTHVKHNRTETVGHNEVVTVGANKAETIAIAKALSIGAGYAVTVGAGMNTAVGLGQYEEVGVDKTVMVGTDFSLTAGDSITLTVGKSALVMKKDGTVTLNGKTIDVIGSDHIQLDGKRIDLN